MNTKIVLARRKYLSDEEKEFMNNSTFEQIVDRFGVISVFYNKKIHENFELPYFYLAMKKNGALIYLDVKTGEWLEELKEPIIIDLPAMYHHALIKDSAHFYFVNDFGYAYKIKKSVFVSGLREMADQLDFSEHKKMSDEEFINTSFFKDVLAQNFELDVADNYQHLEMLGNCDKDHLKEKMLFRKEVENGLNQSEFHFGFQQDC